MTSDDLIKLAAGVINDHERAGRVMAKAFTRHQARPQSARLKADYEQAAKIFAAAQVALDSLHLALVLKASELVVGEREKPVLRVVK